MNPLDNLIDIAEPSGVSTWPIAWGWWVVIALVCIAIIFALFAVLKHRKLHAARKQCIALLTTTYQSGELTLATANSLLKRFYITYAGRKQVARLHGSSWVKLLTDSLGTGTKSLHIAQQLSVFECVQYQAKPPMSEQDIFTLTMDWLNTVDLKKVRNVLNTEAKYV